MKRWPLFVTTLLGILLGVAVVEGVWGAPLLQAGPAVPHTIEGREACLTCHPAEGDSELVMPEDHAGRTEAMCLACHSAPEEPTVEAAPTTAEADPTAPPPTVAPEAPDESPTLSAISAENYKGPEFCTQCHSDYVEEWTGSTHALAFQDTIFQESWLENRQPGYCLKCHATGYNPNTGLPVAEGITCESCHGVFDEGHPQVMMLVDAAAERCGVCHETTYQEWLLSGHSQRGVKCASCHAVHSQGLLFATSTALCANCHGERYEDFAHASHAEHAVTCADCHIYRPTNGILSEGKIPTGHFFSVESEACTQCHTRDSIHSQSGALECDPVVVHDELVERIDALEQQVAQEEEYSARNLLLGATGGGVGGLLIGALGVWLLARRATGGPSVS